MMGSDKSGYIYLMSDSGSALTKIGFSIDPDRRLKEVKANNGRSNIKIVYQRFCEDMASVESDLHVIYADKLKVGVNDGYEWFSLTEKDIAQIICTPNELLHYQSKMPEHQGKRIFKRRRMNVREFDTRVKMMLSMVPSASWAFDMVELARCGNSGKKRGTDAYLWHMNARLQLYKKSVDGCDYKTAIKVLDDAIKIELRHKYKISVSSGDHDTALRVLGDVSTLDELKQLIKHSLSE